MFEDRIRPEFLRSLDGIRFGRLRLTTPDGATRVFAGDQPGPDAALTILDWRMVPALAAKGDIGLTEAYRDGWCDTPDLTALLTLGLMNEDALDRYIYGKPLQALAMRLLYLLNRNTRATTARCRRVVQLVLWQNRRPI